MTRPARRGRRPALPVMITAVAAWTVFTLLAVPPAAWAVPRPEPAEPPDGSATEPPEERAPESSTEAEGDEGDPPSEAPSDEPAEEPEGGTVTETLTVLEEGVEELSRVPGGTGLVDSQEIERTPARNLDDTLDFVPGVLASSRFGADEAKISVRGSGLRNNFHHRGVNILINGIPYQDADGFGDFESIDLMAMERIQIWKGANALRYGAGSMGGAINLVTKTGRSAPPLAVEAQAGSFDSFRGRLSTGGARGPWAYYASASDVEYGGYRDFSDQGRQRLFGNVSWQGTERTSGRIDLMYANVAEELPGALTPAELRADPEQADPEHVANEWGRFFDYARLAGRVEHRVGGRHGVGVSVFGDFRDMSHPIFQILDQDNRNAGGEVRYRFEGGGLLERFSAGARTHFGDTGERRFENVAGEPGALTANFASEAESHALYAEAELAPASDLSLVLGARFESARRSFDDRFLADGDRSDERTYDALSPRLGVVWAATDAVQVFANASRAYEPPLLLELTSFGSAGFLDLEAQDAWQGEVGARGRAFGRLAWDLALYTIEIDDEIINENVRPFPGAPFTIPSYRNAPETRHRGVELGLDLLAAEDAFASGDRLTWRAAYTLSDFRFVDDPELGDNELPGAPPHVVQTGFAYRHPGGVWVAPQVEWVPESYFADSANTREVDGYTLLDLSLGYAWDREGDRWELQLTGTNLTDELYAASVQVDEAAGRYLEPGPGRAASLTVRWRR
ncbi:MAG: TonB-dependent receptor domain-containing protein [Thermoanaerobaculia bacterium]